MVPGGDGGSESRARGGVAGGRPLRLAVGDAGSVDVRHLPLRAGDLVVVFLGLT